MSDDSDAARVGGRVAIEPTYHCGVCRSAGAARPTWMEAEFIAVTEVTEVRKEKARELGADAVIDPTQGDVVEKVADLTDGVGTNVSFDAAGIQETF